MSSEVRSPPEHVSYSQFNDWLRCGKAYELKRIIGVQEFPAWWSIAGNAVHKATERFDLEGL